MKPLHEIRSAKEKKEMDFLSIPGVTGVDIGPKIVDGKETDELAVRVYVQEKKDLEAVPTNERIPRSTSGIKTDVIERTFELHQLRARVADVEVQVDTGTYDPLKGGISIGPCRAIGGYVYTGTLGAIVTDNETGDPLMLSNFHVMCVDDGWSAGDTMTQPSRVDGGSCPSGIVGELRRAVLAGTTGTDGPGVDAAVASISGRPHKCEIVEIGEVKGKATAANNMAVRKRGRTTGLTYGKVDSLDLTVKVPYGDGLGDVILSKQIAIVPDTTRSERFGQKGDSGSVVVNDDNKIVGLYFAGATDGSMGVANPIQAVLDAVNIKICVPTKAKEIKDSIKDIKEPKEKFESKDKNEIKEFKDKYEIKEGKDKIEVKERIKDFKDFREPKSFLEGPVLPTQPVQPIQPIQPIERRSLEDRLARLEAMLGYSPAVAPAGEGEEAECIDLTRYPAGDVPNPWAVDWAKFLVMDHTGAPLPTAKVDDWGGFRGLNCGFQTDIYLAQRCPVVAVTLVHFSSPARVLAYNSDGSLAGNASMSGPQQVAETLIIAGTDITRVVIYAPQNETILLKICCMAEKPKEEKEQKDQKDKTEIKEKREKLEIKEKREKIEIKEKREKIEIKEKREIKEPKEIREPKTFFEFAHQAEESVWPAAEASLEERIARLEAALAQMTHFIQQQDRPDLGKSALKGESDLR
jgi:hypothetical protein